MLVRAIVFDKIVIKHITEKRLIQRAALIKDFGNEQFNSCGRL